MRMVEADDVESLLPRGATTVDVVFGIDEEPVRAVGDIARRNSCRDVVGGPNQQAAAFRRRRFTSVRADGVDRRPRHRDGTAKAVPYVRIQRVSTTMAIPMPPPMHSDATPYRRFRARMAYSNVVSTRAPLAPMG